MLRLDFATATGDAGTVLLNFEVQDTRDRDCGRRPGAHLRALCADWKKPPTEGHGLGLAITRQYAVMLGGSVRVASAQGEGSLFPARITRKLHGAVRGRSGRNRTEIYPCGSQREFRILVVDDEPENRQLLQRLLKKAGFQVRVAEEGQQAVEMFQSWRPHFIWMDLRMAGVDGAEAARRIREAEGGKR